MQYDQLSQQQLHFKINLLFTIVSPHRNYGHKMTIQYHLAARCQHHREWPVPTGDHWLPGPVRMLSVHPRSPLGHRMPALCPRTRHVSAGAEPRSVERRSSTSVVDASVVCYGRRHRQLLLSQYMENTVHYQYALISSIKECNPLSVAWSCKCSVS